MENESIWAAGLAARLRLLQVDCADAPATTRQEFFTEEIGRALQSIPSGKRDAYLSALSHKFPAWGAEVGSAPASDAAAASPEELVERLLRSLPQLEADRKEKLAARLAAAGLGGEATASAVWEIPEELRKKLGLEQGGLQPENAARLLALLLQEFVKLENLTWETWSQLAPRSAVRRDPAVDEVKGASARWLRGEAGAGPAQCQQSVEKTRKMMAGLLAAIALGGKEFAEEYMVRFLPKNIEDVVHSRGGVSLFGDSVEKKCWAKYKELAYGDPGAIEKKLRDALARQAEEIAKKA